MINICSLFNCSKNNICCNPIHWKCNLLYGGGQIQWHTLIHNGPLFPDEYVQKKIPIIVNSREIILPPLAEEYAMMFAKYIDTKYYTQIFKKNFWNDFKSTLPKELGIITLDQINFTLIQNYLIDESDKKKLLSKEEKELIKKNNEDFEKPYKCCIIDGATQNVGNFKIEPPGIFLGRGNHPKLGSIKKRIFPEDVIINLSKDAQIPEPNMKNRKWKEIIHDQTVIWLSSWKEEITNKNKYIFTSMDSIFKSKSDESKFDLARKLKKKVNTIKTNYEIQLTDDDLKTRQLATALYFIDNLALRIGGDKDTNEAADTVGVTSLRVEHITLLENNLIKLDFLGKDSIRFCKKISVHSKVYENLQLFMNQKHKRDKIFDLIKPSALNDYLNSFMKNLTAKVWRTYNASVLFQKELDKIKEDKILEIDENERLNYLLGMFNLANTDVALLCNHQKTPDKSNDKNIKKLDLKLTELKQKKKKN
jgi:DNA topoisomerase-1